MTAAACATPIPLAALIGYERGELVDADEAAVEAHFFGCEHCARRLDALHQLRVGIVDAVATGSVTSGATAALVDRARDRGVTLRGYRLAPGDTVPCTCSPTDDFVAVRLVAPIGPGERVDLDVETALLATGEVQTHARTELAVDHVAGEVIVLYAGHVIRAAPRSRWTMRLRATGPAGARVLGPYTLDHTPWGERPPGT